MKLIAIVKESIFGKENTSYGALFQKEEGYIEYAFYRAGAPTIRNDFKWASDLSLEKFLIEITRKNPTYSLLVEPKEIDFTFLAIEKTARNEGIIK